MRRHRRPHEDHRRGDVLNSDVCRVCVFRLLSVRIVVLDVFILCTEREVNIFALIFITITPSLELSLSHQVW